MGTLDKVKGLVENPPKEYRSAPFWGWNDRLQKENLGEQIEGFKKAGMGGFFMAVGGCGRYGQQGKSSGVYGQGADDGVRESRGAGGTGEAKYRGRKDSYRGLGFVNVWRESKRGRKFHVWQERR